MKTVQLALLFLLFPAVLFSQEISLKRERTFTGTGLYGFMNGGAELFMEYDVISLVTRDVVYGGEEFTVDIYEMPTSEDAFGIYSMHVFRCERADTLSCINCLSAYQLQAICGNKYASIVFPSGSSSARAMADEVMRTYLADKSCTNPEFPDEMDLKLPYSSAVKYVRGPLSALNASQAFSSVVKEIPCIGAWVYVDKLSGIYYAWVNLPDKAAKEQLKAQLKDADILLDKALTLYFSGKEKEEAPDNYGPFGF